MLRKVSIFSSIGIYLVIVASVAYLLHTSLSLLPTISAETDSVSSYFEPPKLPDKIVIGEPTRIVIGSRGIDLAVGRGSYNAKVGDWTLSDTRAQFATITERPNNKSGMTYIYGHGTDRVFGKIGTNTPPIGTSAKIYTDNNHIFTYRLISVRNLNPSDTSIFKNENQGRPRLVLQTCTGIFSEWRTIFTFTLEKVA